MIDDEEKAAVGHALVTLSNRVTELEIAVAGIVRALEKMTIVLEGMSDLMKGNT